MINRPPSNFKPLDSEETRMVAKHILEALTLLPNHRHNKRSDPLECGECTAKVELIKAFKYVKRFGQ